MSQILISWLEGTEGASFNVFLYTLILSHQQWTTGWLQCTSNRCTLACLNIPTTDWHHYEPFVLRTTSYVRITSLILNHQCRLPVWSSPILMLINTRDWFDTMQMSIQASVLCVESLLRLIFGNESATSHSPFLFPCVCESAIVLMWQRTWDPVFVIVEGMWLHYLAPDGAHFYLGNGDLYVCQALMWNLPKYVESSCDC